MRQRYDISCTEPDHISLYPCNPAKIDQYAPAAYFKPKRTHPLLQSMHGRLIAVFCFVCPYPHLFLSLYVFKVQNIPYRNADHRLLLTYPVPVYGHMLKHNPAVLLIPAVLQQLFQLFPQLLLLYRLLQISKGVGAVERLPVIFIKIRLKDDLDPAVPS